MNFLSVRPSDSDLISSDLHELLEARSARKEKWKNTRICFEKEWMQKSFI